MISEGPLVPFVSLEREVIRAVTLEAVLMNRGVTGLLASLQEGPAFFIGLNNDDQAEFTLAAEGEGVGFDT